VRFIQQARALFVDDLAALGQRVLDRRLPAAALIGADEANAPDFAVDLAADVSGGAKLAVLVDRRGLDRKTLVVHGFDRRRSRGATAEQ